MWIFFFAAIWKLNKNFLPKSSLWKKEEKGNFIVEKPNKHYIRQVWSRLISTVVSHVNNMYLWYDLMKITLDLCGLPPEVHISSQDRRKHQTNLNWRTFYKITDLKIVKAIKNKENLKNCYNQEESKEAWWLKVMWCPGWDPRTENEYWVKTKEIWIIYGL